jgi:hypothetical protein
VPNVSPCFYYGLYDGAGFTGAASGSSGCVELVLARWYKYFSKILPFLALA